MIVRHGVVTIERKRAVRASLTSDGGTTGVIRPVARNHEYVLLVVGTVRQLEQLAPDEVIDAARELVMSFDRALDYVSEV